MITITEDQHLRLFRVSRALRLVSDLASESDSTDCPTEPESLSCFLSLMSEIVGDIHNGAGSTAPHISPEEKGGAQ